MNIKQIIDGIELSDCRDELSAHLDLVELAIDNERCDLHEIEWSQVETATRAKAAEFSERIYH